MKITLPIDTVLDDIYADSALGAVMGLHDAARPVPLLTRDHRQALMRLAVQAAAHVCAMAELSGLITAITLPSADDPAPAMIIDLRCDCSRRPATEAIELHLRAAVSAATLHFVALTAGDIARADRFTVVARNSASIITALLTAPRPFEARMSLI